MAIAGFALHTVFLYLRGQAVGRCPLTNLFETQAFIAWAAVLFFLLIGPSYRVSFLGAFTAPLVLLICLAALILLPDAVQPQPATRSAWVEFHAAIAILASGAFALAFVTGECTCDRSGNSKTAISPRRSFSCHPSSNST